MWPLAFVCSYLRLRKLMSTETWFARGECAIRAHACGHVAHVAQPSGALQCPIVCVQCGCGRAGALAPVIDCVPTAELTWDSATCSKAVRIQAHTGDAVRLLPNSCPLLQLHVQQEPMSTAFRSRLQSCSSRLLAAVHCPGEAAHLLDHLNDKRFKHALAVAAYVVQPVLPYEAIRREF